MTAYLNSFTGSTIASSNATLNTITYIASQPTVNLVWNLNGYDNPTQSTNYAATYLILNGSAVASPVLVLPIATAVSPGEEITLVNTGTTNIAVKLFGQAASASLIVVNSQQSAKVVLQSNATNQGVWQVVTVSAAGGLASLTGLAGRGLTTRLNDLGTTVFDTVWPRTQVGGGTQTLYAALSSQMLTFSSPATVTLANQVSATDPNQPPPGTYFILKNVSNGRLTVTANVLDGVTAGQTYVNPGAFGIFIYADSGAWFSLIGATSVGTSINSSSGLSYNASIVDCLNGSGAQGAVYTLQNQDFGTVISFENVQSNQVVILPLRVSLYVVQNTGLGVSQNIQFKGTTSPGYNTVTIAGSQFSVLATDGLGNVYPGVSSLPGGQFVNANPGTAAQPGIFFDNDESTGFYSNNVNGAIGVAVAGLQAALLTGNASAVQLVLGTLARAIEMTINGNLTVTGNLNALGGLDGGVI